MEQILKMIEDKIEEHRKSMKPIRGNGRVSFLYARDKGYLQALEIVKNEVERMMAGEKL